ncbi:MAG: hypothetical protein FGM15_05630 [Chthoniobacterales bacterium]|nr:hypothetical protein [Chthoniobacterales bacterium]
MRWVSWILLAVYAAFLLAVIGDFRAVMGDEAAYIDPALRWCDGLGFTSAAWWQSPEQLWACNVPLYAVVAAAWVKVTGLSSLWGLRALSLLLYVSGIAFWILGCRRAGWFKSPAQQAVFVALLLGSLYATAPSQYIRPEALAALILGLSLWGQTLSSSHARSLAAFLSGVLASLSGLQFAVTLSLFGLVWWLGTSIKPWRSLVWCLAGGVAGFLVLAGIYFHSGVLEIFLRSTFGLGSNRMAQWHGWRDPMLWTGSAVLVLAVLQHGIPRRERYWAAAGLAAGPGLAAVLFLLSKYPQYYGFLAALPTCTAVAAVYPCFRGGVRLGVVLLLVAASLAGFPLAALMNWNLMSSRQHDSLERWTDNALDDVPAVFVDPAAYFAAKHSKRLVYTHAVLPALTSDERNGIEALVLMPEHPHHHLKRDTVLQLLGGTWKLAGAFRQGDAPPSRFPLLDVLSRLSYAGTYRFEVWRREHPRMEKSDDDSLGAIRTGL